MDIDILKGAEDYDLGQIDSLLHQLDEHAPELDKVRLLHLLEDPDFELFIARESCGGTIVGMLSLTCCQTLSRPKYWIEDVIVDISCRGSGIGRALVEAAVSHVRHKEVHPVIYLTSNPSRTAARNLYRSVGFEDYETGVFRIK